MGEKIPQPKWVLYVRAARALLAVAVLGLCAYTLQIIAMSQAAFNIFVAVFTVLVAIYVFVAEVAVPRIYNRWIVLAVEVLTLIFWLAAFASLAALAGNADACFDMVEKYDTVCYARNHWDKRGLTKRGGVWDLETAREWNAVLASASGLGGICFILSVILVVILSLSMRRHRHAQPGVPHPSGGAPVPMQNVVVPPPMYPEKSEPPYQGQPAYAQPTYMPTQYVPTPPSSPPLPSVYSQPQPTPQQVPQPMPQPTHQPVQQPMPQPTHQPAQQPMPQATHQPVQQPVPYQHSGVSELQQPSSPGVPSTYSELSAGRQA